jgi:hypothetical protein
MGMRAFQLLRKLIVAVLVAQMLSELMNMSRCILKNLQVTWIEHKETLNPVAC